MNPTVYGTDTNAFVLKKGDVVDIIVNNDDPGKHPFHLHGHAFQVLARSDDDVGHWNSSQAVNGFPQVPMRRDTLMVRPQGNFLIRFVADNPGVWFFHCHIYWHLVSGLAAVMVEAPLELQSQLSIPSNHYEVSKIPTIALHLSAADKRRFAMQAAFHILVMRLRTLRITSTSKARIARLHRCPQASPPEESSRWSSAVWLRSLAWRQ